MCGSGSMLVALYCSMLPAPILLYPILLYGYPILLSMLRGPGRPEDQQCFMLPIRPPTYISTNFPLQLYVIMHCFMSYFFMHNMHRWVSWKHCRDSA